MATLPSSAERVMGRRELLALRDWRTFRSIAIGSDFTRDAALISGFAAVLGLWIWTHPYTGVALDARIYMGRALADLSPATIGSDLMFARDGQSPFSLFTRLARLSVAKFGVYQTSAAFAFAAMAAWFCAMTAFASRIATGRLLLVMIAGLAVLPRTWGGLNIISFGEALALPRPFAEAGVLAAFAMLLDGRRLVAGAFLLAAALFHPIMAVCGLCVVILTLAWNDRRLIPAVLIVVVVVLGAGYLGAPVANRLFQGVDPAWLDLLRRRNPYLFPGLWTMATWCQATVQITTALIASALLQGRAKTLFIAAIAAAIGGVACAWLFGDVFPNRLALQVQPWRTLWITAVIGALAAPFCAVKLWRAGPGARLVIAALSAAWLFPDHPVGVIAALLGMGTFIWSRRCGRARIGRFTGWVAWSAVGALVAVHLGVSVLALLTVLPKLPRATPLDLILRAPRLEAFILCPLAMGVALLQSHRSAKTAGLVLTAVAAVMLLAGSLGWYREPPHAQWAGETEQRLNKILSAQAGAVEWIDGDTQPWMIAGRANWATELQGASIVFSRDQAMLWQDRMRRLMTLGLVSPHVLQPFNQPGQISSVTPGALAALCATRDGPLWIISHVLDGEAPPDAPNTTIWRLRRPWYLFDGVSKWRAASSYAVTRCPARRQGS